MGQLLDVVFTLNVRHYEIKTIWRVEEKTQKFLRLRRSRDLRHKLFGVSKDRSAPKPPSPRQLMARIKLAKLSAIYRPELTATFRPEGNYPFPKH